MEENVYLTFPDNYTAWFNAPGKPETISYTFSIATAPEPATWAMLVVGLGLIGAALRRRTLAAACG